MSLWFIQLIPTSWLDTAAFLILIVGAVMFFAGQLFKYTPFVKQYNLPLRIIGFILLMAGAYFNGGLGVEMEYRERIAEMEEKIAIAEAKSKEENIKIVKEIETKTEIIKQDTVETLAEIERLKEQLNANCELSPEVITIYNQGMTGESPLSKDVIEQYNESIKGGAD
jgi:hypothetical protein